MSLTSTDIRDIETMIRKEIKSFMDANTVKQFEDKMMDTIAREIKRGKLEGDVKEIVIKMLRELYQFMWTQRGSWESRLKTA